MPQSLLRFPAKHHSHRRNWLSCGSRVMPDAGSLVSMHLSTGHVTDLSVSGPCEVAGCPWLRPRRRAGMNDRSPAEAVPDRARRWKIAPNPLPGRCQPQMRAFIAEDRGPFQRFESAVGCSYRRLAARQRAPARLWTTDAADSKGAGGSVRGFASR